MACDASTGIQESNVPISLDAHPFADGVRGVKIVTSDDPVTGSFAVPTSVPAPALIPSGFPGYDGSSVYRPGVSAIHYFSADSSSGTLISKPDWIKDVQLGITDYPSSGSHTCATFGRTGTYDANRFYRLSESDCIGVNTGGASVGGTLDTAFVRVILNRDPAYLGSRENIMVQVEYQATGLRLNPDPTSGTSTNPEDNVDHLWKLFWYSSLNQSTIPTPFSVFVPPVYAAQSAGGSGSCTTGTCIGSPYGAPITTKQILLPVSAYPNQSVIQFSRVRGRIDDAGGAAYIHSFDTSGACDHDSPLCLGLVIRSITVLRM